MISKNTIGKRDETVFLILQEWWKQLQDKKGDRAELRRSKNLQQIRFCKAYYRLLHDLNEYNPIHNRLALVTGVLSHVDEDSPILTLGVQMAMLKKAESSDSPAVSEIRFRKIITITDLDDLFIAMIRTVRMLGNQCNLADLANILYFWGDRTKKQLAEDYYLCILKHEKTTNKGESQ